MITHRNDYHAAFFEDWSRFASLDDLPDRPVKGGNPIIYGSRAWGQWSQYRCDLRLGDGWIGGPHFEIVVPNRNPPMLICRRLPCARQHPGLHGPQRIALASYAGTWHVPAEHWRAVRAVLPKIKESIVDWLRTQ